MDVQLSGGLQLLHAEHIPCVVGLSLLTVILDFYVFLLIFFNLLCINYEKDKDSFHLNYLKVHVSFSSIKVCFLS